MPIKGIKPEEETIIKSILEPYKDKYGFYFYGSRVKGNFRPLSDLDILIKGSEEAKWKDVADLKEQFDQSRLPYIVNFADYYSMDEKFYNLIKDDLVQV